MTARRALAVLAGAAVVLGIAARIIHFDDTMLGDELSTLYIVKGHSLHEVWRLVKSDAEISPPLYFGLAWLFAQLGSTSELIRTPALIAGLSSIPLSFLLARRLFDFSAGMVAAAVMALNPFMVFYATESRPYTLAIALLLGSTLAMLIAAERRSARWWALYAVLVALAMYSHYTAAFVLGAQLLWLIWARPQARAPALIATGAAALAYLPWVPGVLADARSPTVDVLSALQGNGFSLKLNAIANWAFGYPYQSTGRIPGELPLAIGVVAVAFLGAAAGARLLRSVREHEVSVHSDLTESLALAAVIALAIPLAEVALLLAGGTDLFGARNLDLASGGFAVLLGGLAAVAGPRLGAVAIGALLAVFAVGTLKSVDSSYEFADYHAAAAFIDRSARQHDVVVDMESPLLSPVPTTSIEAQMTGDRPIYNLYQPTGPPPFLSGSPPPAPILKQALRRVGDGRLYVVAGDGLVKETEGGVTITLPAATIFRSIGREPPPPKVINLPGWRVAESGHWPGVLDVNVYALSPPKPPAPRARASP